MWIKNRDIAEMTVSLALQSEDDTDPGKQKTEMENEKCCLVSCFYVCFEKTGN